MKTVGGARRSRYRGRLRTRFSVLMSAAAYDLLRISKLQVTA